MKKVKFDERLENALNAFFENGQDTSRFEMTYTGGETSIVADRPAFTEKADKWLGILREIVMFGPGTFHLFFSTLYVVFNYPTVTVNFYGYLLAIFLTYAGLGSIKNLRNLAVPAAIIAMALAFVPLSTLILGSELAGSHFWDSIYLFPFVLITAKFVQWLVSDK